MTLWLVGNKNKSGGECTRQYSRNFFPATQNEILNLVNRADGAKTLNAKCNKLFLFDLQTKPDGANKLSRANRIRNAMAIKAKVRTVLIAQEVMRIKCAKLWGVINPANLLMKLHTLNDSNLGEQDNTKVSSPKIHSIHGERNQQLADSSKKLGETTGTANSVNEVEESASAVNDPDTGKEIPAKNVDADKNPAPCSKANRTAADMGVSEADPRFATDDSIVQNEANQRSRNGAADQNPAQQTPISENDRDDSITYAGQRAPLTGPDTVEWSDVRRRHILGSASESDGSADSLIQPWRICHQDMSWKINDVS